VSGSAPEDGSPAGADLHLAELPGQDVCAGEAGTWDIPSHNSDTRNFTVHAARLKHSVPTVGYIIQEKSYPGALNTELVKPQLMHPDNVAFLHQQGISKPLILLGKLKKGECIQVKRGDTIKLLRPEDVLGPLKQGRKVTGYVQLYLIACGAGCYPWRHMRLVSSCCTGLWV